MNDSSSHARQWLAKAKNDLVAGERLIAAGGPYDAVCFHAQQAAEKALKSLLAFAQAPIPHTHIAVESRYDLEFSPDEQTARQAVSLAGEVCAAVAAAID